MNKSNEIVNQINQVQSELDDGLGMEQVSSELMICSIRSDQNCLEVFNKNNEY